MIRVWLLLAVSMPALLAETPELDEQLLAATRKGDIEAVKSLLDKGASVNAKSPYGSTPLFFASDRGHTEIVKLLLDRGADVNVKDTFYGATALGLALEKKRTEIAKLLIGKGADASEVLADSAESGDAEMVKLILAKGGLKPATLSTALSAAAKHPEIAELLKKAGAGPPPEIHVDAETLAGYTGKYTGDAGFDFTFAIKDGRLEASSGDQPFALLAVSKDVFKPLTFQGVTLEFAREGEKVTSVTMTRGEQKFVLKRVAGAK